MQIAYLSDFECLARDHSVRETLHCHDCIMLELLLLLSAFMRAIFDVFNLQRIVCAYALHNIRRRRILAMAAYQRFRRRQRRLNIRRRFWRLPRPVYSWFDIHFNDHASASCRLRNELWTRFGARLSDWFDSSFCFQAIWPAPEQDIGTFDVMSVVRICRALRT